MKENQLFLDKAIALYFNLHNRYGYGDLYRSVKVGKFSHKFDFTNLRIGEKEFSIGIDQQEHSLVTVIFCDKPDAFKKKDDGNIIYTLYAGKIGPKENRHHFYSNTVKLMNSQLGIKKPLITAHEIIQGLGQLNLKHPAPNDINKAPFLQLFFDNQGRVSEIKDAI